MDRLMEAIAELERAFAESEYKSVKIELCQTAKTCEIAGRDGEAIKRPMTNRQWLESLSDDEFSMCIARLACSMTNCSCCDYFENGCKDTMAQECTEFLREEHKEVEE